MNELAPNVDIYGTYARASALADFIELASLHGFAWSKVKLADYINDLSWGSKIHENFLVPSSGNSSADEEGEGLGNDNEEAADRVFSLFTDRQDYLGTKYPFHLNSNNGQLEVLNKKPSPYLVLLAITIAHAFDIDVNRDPHEVFEETVSEALNAAGHTAMNFARFRNGYSTFNDALVAAGPALSLHPIPLAAPISRRAQDDGGDVLAHVSAGYSTGGIGAWTLVGQATCGQSNTWDRKLGEVKAPAWRMHLGVILPPQPFLAIPHHAERDHLYRLIEANQGMVLDRLRLTMMLDAVSDDEQTILNAVLDTPVVH